MEIPYLEGSLKREGISLIAGFRASLVAQLKDPACMGEMSLILKAKRSLEEGVAT